MRDIGGKSTSSRVQSSLELTTSDFEISSGLTNFHTACQDRWEPYCNIRMERVAQRNPSGHFVYILAAGSLPH